MKLDHINKKPVSEVADNIKPAKLEGKVANLNKLIKGNNLQVMRTLLDNFDMAGKIDLVYIDPPFATNTTFRGSDSRTATVSSSLSDDIAYEDKLLGANFLEFLRERLLLIRELMSDQSSIYLHIDYKIGHYVKIVMDEVFGIKNFRNDITRIKCNPKNFQRAGYGNIKDLILFYTKTNSYVWNNPEQKKSAEEILKLFSKIAKDGRRYTTTPLHAPGETINGNTGKKWKNMKPPAGRHWRSDPAVLDKLDKDGLVEWSATGNPRKIVYAESSPFKKVQDIWEYKDPQYPKYPTEKNLELLRFIIKASSNQDSIVLDCFSGSGTTLIGATELGRKWIGIDNSPVAIKATTERLKGMPVSLPADNKFDYLSQTNQ